MEGKGVKVCVCICGACAMEEKGEEMRLSAKYRKWKKNSTKQTLHPLNGT